jgi:hypothetical protein
MIVGVGLSIWRLLEFPEQIIPVSPPQSLAAMLLRCLGIWIAAGLFFGLAVELFFNLWRMQVLPKRRTLLVIGAPLAVYIGIYLVTTTVRLQGQGGLSGPLKVRVFASERHLIAFYPLYLVERWIRNASFVDAVYYFNVDFKDAYYTHPWLYDDGVYGLIWYDF